MEDEPKITTVQKVKDPKRVEQGKRLAAISREAKARKVDERKKAEELCIENTNMLYVTVGVLGVAGLGYVAYNSFSEKEKEPQQQQVQVEQPQPKKNNFESL